MKAKMIFRSIVALFFIFALSVHSTNEETIIKEMKEMKHQMDEMKCQMNELKEDNQHLKYELEEQKADQKTQAMGDLSEFIQNFRSVYTSNLEVWKDSKGGEEFMSYVKDDPVRLWSEIKNITTILKMPYPLSKEDFEKHLQPYEFIYQKKNPVLEALKEVYLDNNSVLRLPPKKLKVIVDNPYDSTMKRIAGDYIFETDNTTFKKGTPRKFGSWYNEKTQSRIIPDDSSGNYVIEYDESLTCFSEGGLNANMEKECVVCKNIPSDETFNGYNRLCMECQKKNHFHCRDCMSTMTKNCSECNSKLSQPIRKHIKIGKYKSKQSNTTFKPYCPSLNKWRIHNERKINLEFMIKAENYEIETGMTLFALTNDAIRSFIPTDLE